MSWIFVTLLQHYTPFQDSRKLVEGQLLNVKGVISFTFNMPQHRCAIRVRSDIKPEVLLSCDYVQYLNPSVYYSDHAWSVSMLSSSILNLHACSWISSIASKKMIEQCLVGCLQLTPWSSHFSNQLTAKNSSFANVLARLCQPPQGDTQLELLPGRLSRPSFKLSRGQK